MKILSVLLKVISILIAIAATLISVITVVGAEDAAAAYIIMGIIWLCCLIVALGIWSTGTGLSEIVKIKNTIRHLAQQGADPADAEDSHQPADGPESSH